MILFSRTCTVSTLVFALCLYSTSAYALSCAARVFTLADAYEEADSIIVGIVTACEQAQSTDVWVGGGSGCSFATLEVLKDSSTTRDYGGIANSAACGLALQVGHQYLLFLDSENQPLWYSEPLGQSEWADARVNQRIGILRDFRNGVTADLSEPWVFHKSIIGACTLSHSFRGNQLSFTRRPVDAVPLEEVDWAGITVDGRPVFGPEQIADIKRQIAESPEEAQGNDLALTIRFQESWPRAARNASVRIGNRSWPLERHEHSPRVGNASALDRHMFYTARGSAAEEILAALETPSDVVATAALALEDESNAATAASTGQQNTAAVSEGGATASDAVSLERPKTQVFAATPPQGGSTDLSSARPQRGSSSRLRLPAPDPLLRFETRSTNLARVIDEYRSCYLGESK